MPFDFSTEHRCGRKNMRMLPNILSIESWFDAVAFDFDGVILESTDIKTAAFRALFADQPDALERILSLHETHGGVSRLVKFDLIYRDILKQPLLAQRRAELSR